MVKTQPTTATIKERFFDMQLHNQVAVYGEALVNEKYELLSVLKNLIRTKDKPVFKKMVEDYVVANYGKHYKGRY